MESMRAGCGHAPFRVPTPPRRYHEIRRNTRWDISINSPANSPVAALDALLRHCCEVGGSGVCRENAPASLAVEFSDATAVMGGEDDCCN